MNLCDLQDPMLDAYRLWFEHARPCPHCAGAERCGTGQELWDAHLRERRPR